MRQRQALLVGVAMVLAGVLAMVLTNGPTRSDFVDTTTFEGTSLPLIAAPAAPVVTPVPPPPKARFSRTVWTSTSLQAIDPALDQCRGPVAADLGKGHPIYVAEHDYCGGSAWMWKLQKDDTVALDGAVVDDGLYVVTGLSYFPRKSGANVGDLPDSEVVLQTCVSATQMVFIALEKYEVVG